MAHDDELTYIEAVNRALRRALNEDDSVLIFGEDVGKPGGVFGATRGLRQEFGSRVFDTPISEAAILGAAVGSSIMGMRPVVEIMWMDFTLVAVDQIVNQAANTRYASNGLLSAPMTIRTQQGILAGSCAQHSQSLEALYAHIPGIRVCVPSRPQDAHDLLLTAIRDDDPALVIESRSLYFTQSGPVDLSGVEVPIGKARVARPQNNGDVTIVSWGSIMPEVEKACDELKLGGISPELVDLRWLAPFDLDTILESIHHTNFAVVVHEANVTGGFGAEIAASVTEHAFGILKAPVLRIGAPDLRIPAAPSLQQAIRPDAQKIVKSIKALLNVEADPNAAGDRK